MRSVIFTSVVFLFFAFMSGCDERHSSTGPTNPAELSKSFEGDVNVERDGNARNFRAHLAGRSEVPPVSTRAQGQAIFHLSSDGTELHYKLIVANIENVLQAHIHVAPAGSNGGVVAFLYPSGPPPVLIPGRFSGVLAEGTITAANLINALAGRPLSDLIDVMSAGNSYVNVHTTQNPAGEIRGQIH